MRTRFDGDGPWELSAEGFEVEQITFAAYIWSTSLPMGEPCQTIRFEGRSSCTSPAAIVERIGPQNDPWERYAGLFALRHDTIGVARSRRHPGSTCGLPAAER